MASIQSPSTLDNNLTTGGTNSQGLADWAAPYITDYLGKAQALSNTPYQVYQGPLTAGESALQTQGFKGLAGLTVPSSIGEAASTAASLGNRMSNMTYTPQTTNFFGQPNQSGINSQQLTYNTAGGASPTGMGGQPSIAEQYMNPYLQASLNPQLEEARRQAAITQSQNAAKMTQSGAFGGGRQAIMDAETQRNLGTKLADITGQGYNTAYTNAMAQFNADQDRASKEAQFGATFGMSGLTNALTAANAQGALGNTQNAANVANINAQLAGGNTQRGINAEGIAADKAEFETQRQFPYQQVQYQRDMISGLPISAVQNQPGSMSGIGSLLSALGGGTAAASALGYKDVGSLLKGLGFDVGPA